VALDQALVGVGVERTAPAVTRSTQLELLELVEPPATELESPLLTEVLNACRACPLVLFAFRANAGLLKTPDGKRWVSVGIPGLTDIAGMLVTGRYLAIEVKRPGEKPEPHQLFHMRQINRHGGLAFVARSADDVYRHLRPGRAHVRPNHS
jgi:hypothetical protein